MRAALLLLAQAVAFWPVARWFASRTRHDSAERWELVALAAAIAFLATHFVRERRHGLRDGLVRPTALVGPTAMLVVYAAAYPILPPLLRIVLAVTTMAWTASELIVGRRSFLALWGLLLLALPVIPILQYQLGYPMRALTAGVAAPLLRLGGLDVVQSGACLDFGGRLVWVDAPCSGVRMLWAGLFLTFVLAAWQGLDNARTLGAAAVAIVALLGANVLRTAALFYVEAGFVDAPAWTHAGTGAVLFAAATLAIHTTVVRLGRSSCEAPSFT